MEKNAQIAPKKNVINMDVYQIIITTLRTMNAINVLKNTTSVVLIVYNVMRAYAQFIHVSQDTSKKETNASNMKNQRVNSFEVLETFPHKKFFHSMDTKTQ